MRKRILEYRKYIDELLKKLESGEAEGDIAHIKAEHLVQISFFQHERLIHLIVTVLFAGITTCLKMKYRRCTCSMTGWKNYLNNNTCLHLSNMIKCPM